MSRETIAFAAGLLLIFVGLGVWIFRPNDAVGKSEIEFLGFKFSLDTPALAVMVIGIILMILSQRFHEPPVPPPPPLKRIACRGEHPNHCPGSHDMYYYCTDYFPSDKELSDKLCSGRPVIHLMTANLSGEKCGYQIHEFTCSSP